MTLKPRLRLHNLLPTHKQPVQNSARAIYETTRSLHASRQHNMPLVVPGLNSKDSSSSSDWQTKLMGKKIGETSNETTFAKKDLPETHRVVKEGDMMTMDHNPDRLNIHVGEDNTVRKVTHG
ncbi:hypothetical protein EJ05DRAFT_507628 [Pseudovirgaria hyperparasitica]|uniref:Uncharacterized protein n=1 Tax=Pseudovirgaria hyperparasitica TaxID=470096 RepID=A0A6A6WGV8_9PEZI|nr:uncharacterized protein EJ05DRAFT_507628 [Pseudovirgaria hyperparasitica]KAF2762033.1 hypothetical protein EJ05DRAFT_507628 [Pseudovirgaria hyperparasitica]